MKGIELLKVAEAARGVLTLEGDRVFCDLPEEAMHLIEQLRPHRDELRRVLQQRITEGVKRWVATHCTIHASAYAAQKFLHREFLRSSGIGCSESSFAEEMRRRGFIADPSGMIEGVALRDDFIIEREYERERRSNQRVPRPLRVHSA